MLEVGDGIARVSGLPDAAVNELLEFEGGTLGLALNLDEDSIGAVVLGTVDDIEEGQIGQGHRPHPLGAGRRRPARPGRQRARRADRRQGPDRRAHAAPLEVQAPGIVGRQPVHEPLQTGIKAIDAMTPDRPGSARADHRRPQDRQDHRRDRHDPEPEGSGREVHLRRDRPEGLDRRGDRRDARGSTARWSTRSS